mgnify:CR=1 FL=1
MIVKDKERISKNESRLIFVKELKSIVSNSTNIGLDLAKKIKGLEKETKLPIIANDKLHEIIEKNEFHSDAFGVGYALKNIGILFEPKLKFDFKAMCKKYSRDTYLFIEHKGEIDDKNLYFLTRYAGIKIDLSDLNYTIL